ncbi:MAG: NACHT domain-containing protein, partial [Burkholderiales bacterium]
PMKITDSYVNLAIITHSETKEKEKQLGKAKEESKLEEGFLADYESLHYPKEAIELKDIFLRNKQATNTNKKLIYGRAGIGKSTLVHYAAYQWADGKLWLEFNYVFWLPLRRLTYKKWYEFYKEKGFGANPLACFIHYCHFPNKMEFLEPIMQLIEQGNHSKILLLLDGYDEIAQFHNEHDPIVNRILNSVMDSNNINWHIIMTSRPNAIGNAVQQKFDRNYLETVGLTNENIIKYIQKYYQSVKPTDTSDIAEPKDRLLQFLETNKAIKGMMHIPINLTLLCLTWENLQEKLSKKEQGNKYYLTLSELYKGVNFWLGKRYLSKVQNEIWRDNGKNNIEDYDIERICKDEYKILEQLAFEGLQAGKLIIPPQLIKDLKIRSDLLHKAMKIGLLKAIGDDGDYIKDKDHY